MEANIEKYSLKNNHRFYMKVAGANFQPLINPLI